MLQDSGRYRAVVSEIELECGDCGRQIRPMQEAIEHRSSHLVMHIACQPHFARTAAFASESFEGSFPMIQKWVQRADG